MPDYDFTQIQRIYNDHPGSYYQISDPEGFNVIEISYHDGAAKNIIKFPFMEIEEAELIIIGLQKMVDFLKEKM